MNADYQKFEEAILNLYLTVKMRKPEDVMNLLNFNKDKYYE